MLRALAKTPNDLNLMFVRVALGVVMFPHGAQKLLGWFGGNGLNATLQFFQDSLGVSAPLASLAIAAEFFGGLGLIFGFLSRVAALGIGTVMVVAICLVHGNNGFFMNWAGTAMGEGYEYHILAIGMSLAIFFGGSGALSVDRMLAKEQ